MERKIDIEKIKALLQKRAAEGMGFLSLADTFEALHMPKRVSWRVLFLLHETGSINLKPMGRSAGIQIAQAVRQA